MNEQTLVNKIMVMRATAAVGKHLNKLEDETPGYMDNLMSPVKAKMFSYKDWKEKLDLFKAEVGEEHYKVLASGQSFDAILTQWEDSKKEENSKMFFNALRGVLPADVTDDDIKIFMSTLVSND